MEARPSAAFLPSGTVTLLLTDVEGSSRLWESEPDQMGPAMARHREIAWGIIDKFGGGRPEEQGEGDSILAGFETAQGAVRSAIEIQHSLLTEQWPTSRPIRVRMALHTGDIQLREAHNYQGSTVNRCARLRAIAHGGQVLVSQSTHSLVRDSAPEGVAFKDLGAHMLKDLATPEHVFQLCHADLESEFAPLLSLNSVPNNLPFQLKSFIPRDAEMATLQELLASHRLVTVTGAGGSGKTRLAIQTAAELLDDYPEGVFLVDLAPLTDPKLVVQEVAEATNLQTVPMGERRDAPPDKSLLERLIDHLAPRRALLIFDNCEHVIPASSGVVTRILASCPSISCLVTSREALGVDGEVPWRVPSLSMPATGAGADISLESLAELQSVRLFVERAKIAHPQFGLTPGNAGAVAEIVKRLDGIPLAIELAAARANVITPDQMIELLDDQFRILTGGTRTALERQQTLRASIDWSYNLLDEKERTLLRRLSVFGGGARLEALQPTCGSEEISGFEVLDLLSHLVDKSLLEFGGHAGEARYTLLETIRQYAREKLAESGEGDAIRTKHRDFFLTVAEDYATAAKGRNDLDLLTRIDPDFDNIRLALEWCAGKGEAENGLRITNALWMYFFLRGKFEEARGWINRFLEVEGEVSPLIQSTALVQETVMHFWAGLEPYSEDRFEQVKAAAAKFRSSPEQLQSTWGISAISLEAGFEMALRGVEPSSALDELSILTEQSPDPFDRALAHFQIGVLHVTVPPESGKKHLEIALDNFRRLQNQYGVRITLQWLSWQAFVVEDYAAAQTYLQELGDVWGQLGVKSEVSFIKNQLGYVALYQGNPDEARIYIEEGLELAQEAGERIFVAILVGSLGEVEEVAGNLDLSRSLFEKSLALSEEIGASWQIDECQWGLSRLDAKGGNLQEAADRLRQTLSRARRLPGMSPLWLRRYCQALIAKGDLETAVRALGAHFSLGETTGTPVMPREQGDYQAALDTARATLGNDRYQELWDEGRKLSLDEAIDSVLS